MKPKTSTGYLTPQANRKKITTKPSRRSESESVNNVASNPNVEINDDIFAKLMKDPIKRQLVLQVLASNKDAIDEYKRNDKKKLQERQLASPISKVKKKLQCESPTALLRRRALEQREHISDSESRSSSRQSNSYSRHSFASSTSLSPVPFETILEGVVAYVEIRSKDQDKSAGAKALLRSMGADVRDKFTKDVTHVVFKDGSFTTYQKAKLMKVHLVSILWIDFMRKTRQRQPEKLYPAMGTGCFENNISTVCSQMYKEYEDIIREEYRNSIVHGTPLPSTQSLIHRRRTMMTPSVSSNHLANVSSEDIFSSQNVDREVQDIMQRRKTFNCGLSSLIAESPAMSDEDSDLAVVVNGSPLKSVENRRNHTSSDMELTVLDNSKSLVNHTRRNINMDFTKVVNERTVKASTPLNSREKSPKVIAKIISITTPKTSPFIRPQRSAGKNKVLKNSNSPDKTTVGPGTSPPKITAEKVSNNSNSTDRTTISSDMPSLKLTETNDLEILSKNCCLSNASMPSDKQKSSSTMSSLRISDKENESPEKTSLKLGNSSQTNATTEKDKSHSTMSSLQISSDKDKSAKTTSTNMSLLEILESSDKEKRKTTEKRNEGNNNSCGQNLNKSSTSFQSDSQFCGLEEEVLLNVFNEIESPSESLRQNLKNNKVNTKINKNNRKSLDFVDNITRRKKKSEHSGSANTTGTNNKRLSNEISLDTTNDDSELISPRKTRKTVVSDDMTPNNSKQIIQVKKRKGKYAQMKKNEEAKTDDEENNFEIKTTADKTKKAIEEKAAVLKSQPDDSRRRSMRNSGRQILKKPQTDENSSALPDSDVQTSDSNSDSAKKVRKLRKLYNPDQSIKDIEVSDEKEREEKRNQARKRKSDEGFFIPNPNMVNKNTLSAEKKTLIVADISSEGEEPQKSPRKKTPRGRKNKEIPRVSINSDADEQRELADEFLKPKSRAVKASQKETPRRQSVRISARPKKQYNGVASTDEEIILPIKPITRRSTMDFQPSSQKSTTKKVKIDKTKLPTIVCTKLHKPEIQVFTQIVRNLGGFEIEDEVTNRTTHVVAGEPKRTINMLRAVARGCWVLKYEWLLKSLDVEKWLPEEDYEVTEFSPVVQQSRIQRQAFGPTYSMDVFRNCGPIYVARDTNPRASDLRELITICQGKVVSTIQRAAISVGEYVKKDDLTCVTVVWVLDSITLNKTMRFKNKYLLSSGRQSLVV